MRVTCYTDGSAAPTNPGPSGAGVLVLDEDGDTLSERAAPLGWGTNNQAEFQAARLALIEAYKVGASHVLLRTDSQLLVRQLLGQYAVRNPELERLLARIHKLESNFAEVAYEHVPREQNERADELSKVASSRSAEALA